MVEIPTSLASKIDPLGPHFCLVKKHGKSPDVGGKAWQTREKLMLSTDPKLQGWLSEGGNYGVVGGFGLVIAELDRDELKQLAAEKLPKTFTVLSPGHQGHHLYCLSGLEKPIRLRDKDGVNLGDIQCQGKMVVGPNSIHPNGDVYKVLVDQPLAQVTREQLIEAFKEFVIPDKEIDQVEANARNERRDSKIDLNILDVVPLSGLQKRGNEYFGPHPIHGSETGQNFWVNPSKNCWHCFRHGVGGGPLSWLAVEEGIIRCEDAGQGALRGDLFKRTLQKAVERGLVNHKKTPGVGEGGAERGEEEGRESQATVDKVIALARVGIVKLLHDSSEGSFAVVKGSRHQETHALKSGQFQRWLREKYFQTESRGLRREVITDAVATLEAMAEFDDNHEQAKLHNRVAIHDGAIYYDLANSEWQAVKITAEGWTVVDNPPPLFRRFQHQQPQVLPERGGSLDDLFTIINVKDGDSQLIVKCMLVVTFIYGIPHPILLLIGTQGCGKSVTMRILRMLIDPSRIPLLSFNYNRHETALMLHQHYAAFFDNVSTIPDWLSDILCRACTGDGFTKRQLYTDQDAVILEFKRWIGINGIDVAPEKPDLMDRCLILRLAPIPPKNRKQERQILDEFNEKRPKIFGAILDALSKAMQIFPTLDIKSLPRMADFAKWGEAVARALDYEPNAFLKAYEKILGEQTLAVLEVNPVGLAIMKFMETRNSWQGKPSELLGELELVAEEHKIDTRSKKWPKTAVWLTRRMRVIENDLHARGITVDFGLSGDRVITVQKNDGGGKSGKGGISPTFETTPQHAESYVNGQKSNINPTQQGSGNTANTAVTAREESSHYADVTLQQKQSRGKRLSLKEFYSAFRQAKPQGFTEIEFLKFAGGSGYTEEEAELLLKRDEGVDFLKVADGGYVWL